jgi:polyhydroxyalkanoate synthesis repressor PhaR
MANQARPISRAVDLSSGTGAEALRSDVGVAAIHSGGGSGANGAGTAKPAEGQVVVKKYANRRLYNTESSSYITLDSLAEMVRAGRDFVVFDAKTGEDITRSVLTQIIVEEESKGTALLPTGFLRQLISFYGDSMQGLVPRYLEQALTTFGRQQQQMRVAMQQTMGNFFPFGIEEVSRQNMAMMERAMSLFTGPFYRASDPASEGEKLAEAAATGAGEQNSSEPAALPAGQTAPSPSAEDFRKLQLEIELLRLQLSGKIAHAEEPNIAVADDVSTEKSPATS